MLLKSLTHNRFSDLILMKQIQFITLHCRIFYTYFATVYQVPILLFSTKKYRIRNFTFLKQFSLFAETIEVRIKYS